MHLSAIVAVDNRLELLTHFFDQFPRLLSHDDEIVVVTDGCRDHRSLKYLKTAARRNSRLRVIILPEKVGYGRANNVAVKQALGEILLFLDTDVFPAPGAPQELARLLVSDPAIGAVQGLLTYPQTGRVQSTGHVFSEYLNFHALEGSWPDDEVVQRCQDRQALSSAFYAIRRTTFEDFHGFDEFFFNAWEGMELTLRLSHAGFRCLYTPYARAHHIKGGGRRYYRIDETQQIGYFWSKWGARIRNDLVPLLARQLSPHARGERYVGVNCGSTTTWKGVLTQLGLAIRSHIEIPDRFESCICLHESLPRAFLVYPGPIAFVADHFMQLEGNRSWFEARAHRGDLVVDLRGNVVFPGRRSQASSRATSP